MVAWCGAEGFDLTLIETMPLGRDRRRPHRPVPAALAGARPPRPSAGRWSDIPYRTGGPARYVARRETGGRLGFITPLTHNFCEACNRVRVTCTGTMYMCLGQEDAADLRGAVARLARATSCCAQAILDGIARKPKGHDFVIDRRHQRPARRPPHERHRRLAGARRSRGPGRAQAGRQPVVTRSARLRVWAPPRATAGRGSPRRGRAPGWA